MEVTVLLFGPQADLAGARELRLDTPRDRPTAGEVLSAIGVAAPALTGSLNVSRLAVNHEFVAADRPISPGDEVALIGMVSGG
ncbi:ThiS family protein [Planctomycetes bacterium MalM25]|nr:ThiS family protein [Planctomycetes bacterium MalM25]